MKEQARTRHPRFTHARALRTGAVAILAGALTLAGCEKDPAEGAGKDSIPAGSTAAESKGHGDDHHHANAADELSAHTHATKLLFSSEPAALPVGSDATWTLKIVDTTGAPVGKFDVVHDKLMHLIIVSEDLTWFNHIHPEHKGDGVFTVTTTLPRPGSYKLYADYTPTGGSQEIATHEFATGGSAPKSPSATLTADSIGKGGWILRQAIAAPEGFPEQKGGAAYEVALMPMPGKITAGQDVMLHFQVRDKSGKPVAALEPYLGAMGHAVILSNDSKIYLHTHPMDGGDHSMHGGMNHGSSGGTTGGDSAKATGGKAGEKKGPGSDVIFHTNFPFPGLYKVWGQFQHNGKIVTAPYVLKVDAAG